MMMQLPSIAVLLAAYNGEKYLKQQLISIIEQDYLGQISIIVRDDNSSDNTCCVVTEFLHSTNDSNRKIYLLENKNAPHGHLANFSALAQHALNTNSSDFYLFADQDDVWHIDKVSRLVNAGTELTREFPDLPVLVHSDLRVVDEKLAEISPSFIEFQGLPDPINHAFPTFLYQNVVTGCTCIFNHRLLALATPVPNAVIVHDWWFALCAYYWGKIGYVDTPLIDYRQHGNNSIGAKDFKQQRSIFKKHLYRVLLTFPKSFSKAISQAKELKVIKSPYFEKESDKQWLLFFSSLKNASLSKRLKAISLLFKEKSFKEKVYLSLVLIFLPLVK